MTTNKLTREQFQSDIQIAHLLEFDVNVVLSEIHQYAILFSAGLVALDLCAYQTLKVQRALQKKIMSENTKTDLEFASES